MANKKPSKKPTPKNKNKKTSNEEVFAHSKYLDLVNYVSVLTLNDQTIKLLKSNKNLQSTVEFYIDAIYTYESSNKTNDNYANDFVVSYKTITKKDIELKKLTKKELSDIDDKLGFLEVFIRNTLNVEWIDILNSFNHASNNNSNESTNIEKINSSKQKKDNQNMESETYQTEKTNVNYNYNAEDFMRKNNVSMENIADAYINQQATFLLRKDIMENKFYQYKNKPTVFLILKWLLVVIWVLTSIVIIINNFSTVGIQGSYFFLTASSLPEPTNSSYNWEVIRWYGMLIQNSAIINIFSYIISLMPPILILYYAYVQIRNYKNENSKFTCKTFITWFLLIFVIFSFLSFSGDTIAKQFNVSSIINAPKQVDVSSISILDLSGNSHTFAIDQAKLFTPLMIKFCTNIIYYCFIWIAVILSIVIIITRPKFDYERMQQQIQLYVDDIKSGRITFDANDIGGTGGVFGGGLGRNPFSPF